MQRNAAALLNDAWSCRHVEAADFAVDQTIGRPIVWSLTDASRFRIDRS
jgi:hypothetical protein